MGKNLWTFTTYRLSGGRPQIGDDAGERLADPAAPAQVAPAPSSPACELLSPPLVGLPLAELEERGRVRETLHDRVHEARVAQVLEALGLVGHRSKAAVFVEERNVGRKVARV